MSGLFFAAGAIVFATVLYWSLGGSGRRFPGFALIFLGLLALAGTVKMSCGLNDPGTAVFSLGVTASVCLGWAGYRLQRRPPRRSSADILLATLVESAPSARPVRPEEVLGPWQFYVDAAAGTVTVDLQDDGHYTQVIERNCGERIGCPGGTWTLDGAYLELTSYRSAVRNATQFVRWFFGEWQNELVLYAKDDPQSEGTLLAQRIKARPTF